MPDSPACWGKFKGEIYLVISVCFFGVAFVVMRYATFYKLGPQSFNAGRFFVATICLMVVKYNSVEFPTIGSARESVPPSTVAPKGSVYASFFKPSTLIWGTVLGIINFIATGLLQAGLLTVDANRAGFIQGMYVVFVPLAERLVPGMQSKLTLRAYTAAFMSFAGLYLMSGCAEMQVCIGGAIGHGEIIIFISMLFWVVSIICCSVGAKLVDPITLTLVNFIVATLLSFLCAMVLEPAVWVFPYLAFTREWLVLTVVGLLQAAGFVLCTIGQRYTSPTTSALIMSLESVVCAVAGFLALDETLSVVEIAGCVIMMIATLVALLPVRLSCAEGRFGVSCVEREDDSMPHIGSSGSGNVNGGSAINSESDLDFASEMEMNLLPQPIKNKGRAKSFRE